MDLIAMMNSHNEMACNNLREGNQRETINQQRREIVDRLYGSLKELGSISLDQIKAERLAKYEIGIDANGAEHNQS